ncbi:MAG: divergent polysaccharide deacetylase family protein [Tabrizicola sp.]|uniref:divergent polysaccharide deacetylase family protein n=1 Tax=Tabrizicola sp. TaxID=2005166 RepID=UPI0027365FB1|nr:divergent polysaccharide deacetylase family protein [Tabrizicola sp.]MDP3264091.1 divergent polysaccharide deacetylase family protein [Tabrizicola sp.]MDP3648720.1 divergent polysaccharide deacetylase family protein [Paracoccaceae bacterium]MDZ4066890.1 divergent polysaccharide deacetylase family protein [Tabrizicola sp.]
MALGKFVYGAFVGGVMAAAGLSMASLVAPDRPRVMDASAADPVPAETADTTPQAIAVEPEATAVVPEPVTEAPTVAVAEAPSLSAPTDEPAISADPPAAASDAVAELANDVLTALEPADAPVPPTDPAPKPVDPLPAATSVAPVVPSAPATPEPAASDPAATTVSVVPAPLLPDGPAQPPQPADDSATVKVEASVPPPATTAPEDALIADAGTMAEPTLPEVSDPAPVLPAPVTPETVTPETVTPETGQPMAEPDPAPMPEPDNALPDNALPGTEAPQMPGNKPEGLPRASTVPETAPAEAAPTPDSPEASETFKPTPGFGNKTEGVIINRLPRIGDQPAEEATAAPEVQDTELTPLQRYARAFENPDAKPLFAIVLIDTGEANLDRSALAGLPFAVSFAIDPLAPNADQRAAAYRAAGQEVVMLATGIAEGSNASDIEVAFQSMAQGLPEAVAVMDEADHKFQGNRPLASLVVPVIASQGRGLLTWDQGLNAADQVARRVDLPATVVFRALDSTGEDRAAIRRLLDRAAFKAGQDGRVTVVGHTRPETVAALLEWTVEGRAANVALAPVSAALTVE